jgi:hypothetical protein
MSDDKRALIIERAEDLWAPNTRRSFLRMLGLGGSVVLLPSVFAACSDNSDTTGIGGTGSASLNLSNDTGILNYAYALEQLEAAFYTAVVASAAFGTMTAEQQEIMADLRNHEVIHREFLRTALGGNAIGSLALNATTVGTATSSVANILRNAEAFEDLGVAAYNGAGKYLADANNLLLAGKIVSVEARHAAAIRDLRDAAGITTGAAAGTRFSGDDVVSPTTGLDVKLEPSTVLGRVVATAFVTTSVSIGTGPSRTAATADAGPPNPTP